MLLHENSGLFAMTDNDPNSNPAVPGTKSEADLTRLDAYGNAGDTIELTFTGMELDALLRDPTMHGELSDLLRENADTAVLGDSLSAAADQTEGPVSSADELLADLRDDAFQFGGEDVFEAATHLGESTDEGDDKTFLLTEIDFGDLIGDHEQAWDPGLDSEASFLDAFIAPLSTCQPVVHGAVAIEIEDDESVAAAHILS
jgi:hypothetical protein